MNSTTDDLLIGSFTVKPIISAVRRIEQNLASGSPWQNGRVEHLIGSV